MSRQTPSERLLERLKTMSIPIADDAGIERTYAGRAMRSAGAWVWRHGPVGDQHVMVGSRLPITELIRHGQLCAVRSPHAPEWSIWPYNGNVTKENDIFRIEPERSTQ